MTHFDQALKNKRKKDEVKIKKKRVGVKKSFMETTERERGEESERANERETVRKRS